jgi:hypothetical protein
MNNSLVYRTCLILITISIVLFLSACARKGLGLSDDDSISAYARKIGSAAVLVLKDGEPVYEYGDLSKEYMCHSIRKPFLGALYGIYVERGVIDTHATLGELEIDDIPPSLTPEDCTYVYEEDKSEHSAYFFRMSTRDMALFGELYRNMGTWNGEQIIPEEWIRESTTVYPVSNSGGFDPYGYLWRIIPEEQGLGYGFYHAGLGVHLLAVLPDLGVVMVHRVETDQEFDITWSEIKQLMEMIMERIAS